MAIQEAELMLDVNTAKPSKEEIFSILYLWFIVIALVFFFISKLLLSGFLQFKDNFVRGENNSEHTANIMFSKFLMLFKILEFDWWIFNN